MKRLELTGMKFNHLLVLRQSEKTDKGGRIHWDCICDCGNTHTVEGYNLHSGHVKCCKECSRAKLGVQSITHGHTNSRLYSIWSNMKTRCNNSHCDMFSHYGGKGISFCDEWRSFTDFEQWALENGYQDGLSIDRLDNSKGYNQDNCRWATMKCQQNNRTNNHMITYQGETLTLKQWSEKLGLPYGTLLARASRGWSDEELLTVPIRRMRNVCTL